MDPVVSEYLNNVSQNDLGVDLYKFVRENVEPSIKRTIAAKLHASLRSDDLSENNQDALELFSEVRLLILKRLEKLRSNQNGGNIIENLHGYVTTVTLNAYRQYLRTKYPRRQQLKEKLRYLLTHHPKFSLWKTDAGIWICSGDKKSETGADDLATTVIDRSVLQNILVNKNFSERAATLDLVSAIFDTVKHPIRFDELISVVADTQGINERSVDRDTENDASETRGDYLDDRILEKLEHHELLGQIWVEVCELPLRHRRALLLNLRDKQGDALIRMFPVLHIASIRNLADVLEFSHETFARFWYELPWNDQQIAECLQLTRQQVINLRQSARARIIRRLAAKR